MNWLDITLIIINILIILFGITTIVLAILEHKKNWWTEWTMVCIIFWVMYLFLGWLLIAPFIVLDKSSGITIGKITSVDKNFFGTTALYIKTTENKEEKYCIEYNEELEEIAKNYIGKNVKISYGTRVGLYSTSKCSQAPVEQIELLEN